MSLENLMAKSFEEKDVENLAQLLNLIHEKVGNLNSKEALEYVKLMQWAKLTLMPKIKEHLIGEAKLHEAPKEETKKKSKAKK